MSLSVFSRVFWHRWNTLQRPPVSLWFLSSEHCIMPHEVAQTHPNLYRDNILPIAGHAAVAGRARITELKRDLRMSQF